jgi:hypothetical protein
MHIWLGETIIKLHRRWDRIYLTPKWNLVDWTSKYRKLAAISLSWVCYLRTILMIFYWMSKMHVSWQYANWHLVLVWIKHFQHQANTFDNLYHLARKFTNVSNIPTVLREKFYLKVYKMVEMFCFTHTKKWNWFVDNTMQVRFQAVMIIHLCKWFIDSVLFNVTCSIMSQIPQCTKFCL